MGKQGESELLKKKKEFNVDDRDWLGNMKRWHIAILNDSRLIRRSQKKKKKKKKKKKTCNVFYTWTMHLTPIKK